MWICTGPQFLCLGCKKHYYCRLTSNNQSCLLDVTNFFLEFLCTVTLRNEYFYVYLGSFPSFLFSRKILSHYVALGSTMLYYVSLCGTMQCLLFYVVLCSSVYCCVTVCCTHSVALCSTMFHYVALCNTTLPSLCSPAWPRNLYTKLGSNSLRSNYLCFLNSGIKVVCLQAQFSVLIFNWRFK